jgi:hypothetical protein
VDPEKPEELVETYIFNISYPENGPKVDIQTKGGQSISNHSAQDVKRATSVLMRKLLLFLQTVPVNLALSFQNVESCTYRRFLRNDI